MIMFRNKELEAGILALNVRLDNMQRDINKILELLQEKKPTESIEKDSPFLTKEGLYNYKHRKHSEGGV
jgi:hypothetical protein